MNKEYIEYLNSDHWKSIRVRILQRAGNCCERCGAMAEWDGLHVHHRTYARLWREHDNDLEALCPRCHEIADTERQAAVGKDERERPIREWADRVYGEGWEVWHNFGDIAKHYHQVRAAQYAAGNSGA